MRFEPAEGKTNQLPVDCCSWIDSPLKFTDEVLEIHSLSGRIMQGVLEALDCNLIIDAQMGKACSMACVVRNVKSIGWRRHL